MKILILFIKQINESVLPIKPLLNYPCIRVFRFISCISIVSLFLFKNELNIYLVLFLWLICCIYTCYQFIIITLKIIFICNHNRFVLKNKNLYITSSTCFNIFYYLLKMLILITGLPIIADTIIEIFGDISYIVKSLLKNKKRK